MKNHGPDFRKWIEAGYRDYGKDPWFFIRELAQNSRDAGASSIHVKAELTPAKEERLVFEDDGSGMSYDHAVNYLFRLYASSKANDKYAAGLFGIGFWTVLKFNPGKVIIESWSKGKPWGIEVAAGEDLTTKPVPGSLTKRGTRVTLVRPAREASPLDFQKKIRDALVRYCSYLRRGSRKSEPLPVYFAGENISGEMKLPGPVSIRFKNDMVEGAVGLGPRPKVNLYARGLPVWEGTGLEELSHIPPSPASPQKTAQEFAIGEGLAPVFLLNGSQLEVNISRRRVIDNRKLQTVRQTAERELARMVESAVDCVSPRGFIQRFTDRVKRSTNPLFRHFPKILLFSLLLILPLEYFLIRTFYTAPASGQTEAVVSFQADIPYYSDASVPVTKSGKPPDMVYSPAADTWFKLFTADLYQSDKGFLQGSAENTLTDIPGLSCPGSGFSVEINLRETGRLFLPQPSGHIIVPGSVTLNGTAVGPVNYYPDGTAMAFIPAMGKLRYLCCPAAWEEISPIDLSRLKKLIHLPPSLTISPALDEILKVYSDFSTEKKVSTAVKLTADLLSYDDSEETARKYANLSGMDDWFQKVVSVAAGDCDIINGVTVLFLRKMGVPSRLVIGLVGKGGKVLPQLHAWAEYFADGAWHIVDATAVTAGGSQLASQLPSLPPSNQPSRQEQPGLSTVQEGVVPASGTETRTKTGTETRIGTRTGIGDSRSSEQGSKWPFKLLLSIAAAILAILVLSFFWMLARMRVSKRSFQPGEYRQVEEDLAGMLLHELLHPGVWGREGGIRDYKLLPTINRNLGPISLRQALKMGSSGYLFTCNPNAFNGNNLLVDYLKLASVPILDSGNPAFAPIVKILPGAVYLEQVFDLKAVLPEESALDPLNRLLVMVNKRLRMVVPGAPSCVLAPGFGSGEVYDVDLSPLPSFEEWGIPNRFIVIDPDGVRIKELLRLFKTNPELAQFRLISMVLKESGLIPVPAEVIIEKVSRQLLNPER